MEPCAERLRLDSGEAVGRHITLIVPRIGARGERAASGAAACRPFQTIARRTGGSSCRSVSPVRTPRVNRRRFHRARDITERRRLRQRALLLAGEQEARRRRAQQRERRLLATVSHEPGRR
jgi:hypothetical protein